MKNKILYFLLNAIPFGILLFLFDQSWKVIILAIFYGLIAVFLRPRIISFFNKKS